MIIVYGLNNELHKIKIHLRKLENLYKINSSNETCYIY